MPCLNSFSLSHLSINCSAVFRVLLSTVLYNVQTTAYTESEHTTDRLQRTKPNILILGWFPSHRVAFVSTEKQFRFAHVAQLSKLEIQFKCTFNESGRGKGEPRRVKPHHQSKDSRFE